MATDSEFAKHHRIASETVLRASRSSDPKSQCSNLREARESGKRARSQASNMLEDMLALGLIHAVDNLLAVLDEGSCDG